MKLPRRYFDKAILTSFEEERLHKVTFSIIEMFTHYLAPPSLPRSYRDDDGLEQLFLDIKH